MLSAEDFIYGQRRNKTGKQFIINRDQTSLEFFAKPNKRYFTIIYQFSLSHTLAQAYEEDNQILRGHLEMLDMDDSAIGDENLSSKVAYYRISEVGDEQANRILNDVASLVVHSDCRIRSLTQSNPSEGDGDGDEIWDGVQVIGLLYPYEDDFTPRDYEQVAQEVISVGNQIDEAMAKLDVMQEIDF